MRIFIGLSLISVSDHHKDAGFIYQEIFATENDHIGQSLVDIQTRSVPKQFIIETNETDRPEPGDIITRVMIDREHKGSTA